MQKGTFERTCLLADFEVSPPGAAFPSKEPLSVLCVEERKITRMPLGRRKKSFLLVNKYVCTKEGEEGNHMLWAALCPQHI